MSEESITHPAEEIMMTTEEEGEMIQGKGEGTATGTAEKIIGGQDIVIIEIGQTRSRGRVLAYSTSVRRVRDVKISGRRRGGIACLQVTISRRWPNNYITIQTQMKILEASCAPNRQNPKVTLRKLKKKSPASRHPVY